jgi:DNA-binding transcriptional LysR family regulator
MMLDLRQLQTFRAAAERGSFTRAAAALGYVQSNVTAHIQALEAELGVPLFDRVGRQVILTDAGRRLLDYAGRLLALAEEARQAVSETTAGEVTIGAPETLCTYRLPALLRAARERLPQVRVVFRPLPATQLRQHVRAGSLDLAFTLEPRRETAGLRVEPLADEPVLLLAPPGHPLVKEPEVRPIQIAREPVLLTEAGCAYRALFEQALAEAGEMPGETLEFSSVEAIKQCVIAGMGLAVLPAVAVAGEVARGDLAPLAWTGPALDVTTQLVWNAERWCSPALGSFLALARSSLAGS